MIERRWLIVTSSAPATAYTKPRYFFSSAGQLTRTEVEQLHDRRVGCATAARQNDIGGLQIAVHKAAPVGGVERAGDLDRAGQRLLEGQRTAFQSCCDRLAFEILQHQEIDIVVVPDVVERADVRVGERGDCLGFAIEARAELRVVRERLGEDLQGNSAMQTRVLRPIHLAHAAGTEQAFDSIRAKLTVRFQGVPTSSTRATLPSTGRSATTGVLS